MKILSFILPNPKCERSARTALWKGKGCGVDIEETTSKYQQFYIRLYLQHGELGDTSLRGGPSPLMARGAWVLSCCSLSMGIEAVLGSSRTGSCLPLRASLCHHQGSLAWPETPLHSQYCAKISERDLSLLLYHKTHPQNEEGREGIKRGRRHRAQSSLLPAWETVLELPLHRVWWVWKWRMSTEQTCGYQSALPPRTSLLKPRHAAGSCQSLWGGCFMASEGWSPLWHSAGFIPPAC